MTTFSYTMLKQNLFQMTHDTLKAATMKIPSLENSVETVPVPENLEQFGDPFLAYSLTKQDLDQIHSGTGYLVPVYTPQGKLDIDLKQLLPSDIQEGAEVWLYVNPSSDPPNGYEVLAVTRSTSGSIGILVAYTKSLWVVIPVTLLLAGSLGYYFLRRALKPVEEMTRTVSALQYDNTDRRIEVRSNDELGKLSVALNQTFYGLKTKLDREKQFTADASHELRRPLTIILNEAGVALRKIRTPEEYRQSLGSIRQDIGRMSALVHKLLILARAEDGKEPLNLVDLNLRDLLNDLASDVHVLSDAKGIQLQTDFQSDGIVHGDEIHLRELFLNLVDNAIRYTPPCGNIYLSLYEKDQMSCVAVRDTGIGIAAEHLPRLFTRFYRVNRADDQGGTGLGLTICQHIAEMHGGWIKVESSVGQGSIFTVYLPLFKKALAG